MFVLMATVLTLFSSEKEAHSRLMFAQAESDRGETLQSEDELLQGFKTECTVNIYQRRRDVDR